MPRRRTLAPFRCSLLATLSLMVAFAPAAHAGPNNGTWLLASQPKERYGQTVVHDPVRDRLILFGGSFSVTGANTSFRDVWMLDLSGDPVWTQLVVSGTPPASRYGHSMVYDPVRDRMLVFGGYDNVGYFNDVWELSLSGSPSWTALSPTGAPPSVRSGQVAAYDAAGDRLVVFGGQTTGGAYLNDLWSLSLSGTPAWAPLAPAGTPPLGRSAASWAWDAARERLVLYGGYRGTYLDDVWTLPLTGTLAWSPLSPGGTGPGARAFHSATFDASRDEMVVYAGSNGVYLSDAFRLSFAGSPTWSALSPSGTAPLARSAHSAVRDPLRDRDIVFAGLSSILLADLWALERAGSPAWEPIYASSPTPITPRQEACLVLDTARDRLLMFGGADEFSQALTDLWEMPLATGEAFRPLAFTGTPPTPVFGLRQAALYDPIRDRVLVFGGPPPGNMRLWQLSLTGTPAWTELVLPGPVPTGRTRHTVVYDPLRDRVLVHGGLVAGGNATFETRALNLATMTWSNQTPAFNPTGRYEHSAIWDPTHDRMIVFGGQWNQLPDEIWALGFAPMPTWSMVSQSAPHDRSYSVAVRDDARDRMVMFGGSSGGLYYNDTWELSLASGLQATAFTPDGDPPHQRAFASAVYDQHRDRMLVFGGSYYDGQETHCTNELLSLQFSGIVGVPPGPVLSGPARLNAFPNPSRAHVDLAFRLAADGVARVRIHDVGGRLVRELGQSRMAAGPQSLRWDRRTQSGARAPAGLYFVEVRSDRETFRQRFVLTD